MALETPPFEIHIEKWKQEVQQFGYGRTDTPGIHERRMREDNGRYLLEAWNGTVWKKINEYTPDEILQLLLTVDGNNSGLDADKLDGMEPSPDAGNNTIVQRTANGYIYCNYINTTPGASTNPTHIYGSQDSFIRKVTPQQLVQFILPADGEGTGLDADLYRGKKVQWGSVTNAKDTGIYVYFAEAFSSTPVIVLTPRAEVTTWKTNVSTTYMKIYAASTTNKTVDWLAIG
jgi:hypothetical protein